MTKYSKTLTDGTIIGDVSNISSGTFYENRKALHEAGIHRGLMRGIAPHGSSVVLSGGYIDDQDLDDVIIYTGEGGRDADSGRQTSDQVFEGGNLALARNHLRGIPVRVNRGSKYVKNLPAGKRYRYDGLYRVAQSWKETGRDGFIICRFRLERITASDFQPLSPDLKKGAGLIPLGKKKPGSRVSRVIRVIRDTEVSDYVKDVHEYRCQICAQILETPRGPYAEGCHIKPLGKPHKGPDSVENLLCLCPNCHVQFDEGAVWIDDDMSIQGAREGLLRLVERHAIDPVFFKYHRDLF